VISDQDDLAAFSETRSVLSWVVTQLDRLEPPLEQLGGYIPSSSFLGLTRRAKMRNLGQVWRLGIFLMDRNGLFLRAGDSTRVVETSHIEHVSAYRTERHQLMDAAFRGGFPTGSVVNFNTHPVLIDVDYLATPGSPLFTRGPHTFVRWRTGASDDEAMLFSDYMAERLELLINPPRGATG
jgi:hypothetical protein